MITADGTRRLGYLSLLWPSGQDYEEVLDRTWIDLEMEQIGQALTLVPERVEVVKGFCRRCPRTRETVEYRLGITRELMRNDSLASAFQEVVPILEQLRYYVFRPDNNDWTPLQEVVWRIRELEHYVALLDALEHGFAACGEELTSRGLIALREVVADARSESLFENLRVDLPQLLATVSDFRSISVGINLNAGLVPVEATLLSVSSDRYRDRNLLDTLSSGSGRSGIAPLHSAVSGSGPVAPLLVPLFKDLSEVLRKAARPLAITLRKYVGFNSRMFVAMADEIAFYAGALQLVRRLRHEGLPVCCPTLHNKTGAGIEAVGLVNLDLVLRRLDLGRRKRVVSNDFLPGMKRIVVVTGPNSGGKTTFLQSVGLAQIMAQLGLPVPAAELRFSVADTVLTHYPSLENTQTETGRFGEEAARIQELFSHLTPRSLLLLNETLSTTGSGEAFHIGQDLLSLLREIGCLTLFVTHIHPLAGENVLSLVATTTGSEHNPEPTFSVVEGLPEPKRYARTLAMQHGIEPEELRRRWLSGFEAS